MNFQNFGLSFFCRKLFLRAELFTENTPATIRLSIGTEHIDDIIADLETGFAAI
ncbi:MAG: PLP-dependent transferase [Selenomonadaceae bacterium]|nr:PLP-dependent transferase [Selenomonadaceae bacterium]